MIDWAHIDELRREIGPEEFPEVAEIFLEELEQVVRQLTAASPPADLAAQLHFVKGCSLNLGFAAIARLAGQGERMAEAGEGASVDLPALAACFEDSRTEFLSRFGDSAAA